MAIKTIPDNVHGSMAYQRGGITRNFDTNSAGQPVSTIPYGRWQRGKVTRRPTPQFRPPTLGRVAYDITDPTTWPPVHSGF